MKKQSKPISFEGQTFFVGIDTHKTNWKVTVRSNGLQLAAVSMPPSPSHLGTFMRNRYPGGLYHSVYEAGFCGYWPHRELSRLGFRNIIVNPADVPTTHKEKDRKDDAIDSGKLSREHENHSLAGVYVPTPEMESLRSLVRVWRQYTSRCTQIKNRIKGFLLFTGIEIPEQFREGRWSNAYIKTLQELTFEQQHNRTVLNMHLDDLKYIRKQQRVLLKKMRTIALSIKTIQQLKTIPGIGQIVGCILYVELIDIKRFRNLDHLLSFIGLVPSISSSSDTITVKGITNRHCRHLRPMLIESAWIATRNDPALLLSFAELTKRMIKKRAILRIAKKLVNRIRFVWLHNKPYITAVVE